jgi:adenylylsulfate reductase subunit B
MPPVINKDKCINCGKCVDVCSEDVFFDSKQGEIPNITYPDECWHCSACVQECPVEGAIRIRIPLPMFMVHK